MTLVGVKLAISDAHEGLKNAVVQISSTQVDHGENNFLYMRDPGSRHRVELFSGGYRNYQPGWETRRWVGGVSETGGNDMFRATPMPDAMRELFPAADASAEAVLPDMHAASGASAGH